MITAAVHVSSGCVGEHVVRLLGQAGYLIQSALHPAGSIGPDTARKLSLKVLVGISSS